MEYVSITTCNDAITRAGATLVAAKRTKDDKHDCLIYFTGDFSDINSEGYYIPILYNGEDIICSVDNVKQFEIMFGDDWKTVLKPYER